MFGRLRKRRLTEDAVEVEVEVKAPKSDKAIIHQSVPDEVLYPDRKPVAEVDMSWLKDMPEKRSEDEDRSTDELFAQTIEETVEAIEPEVLQPAAPEPLMLEPTRPAMNAATGDRPPFPHGWLVVVEGPGVGQWFVLERGVSHLGSAEDQTVRLDFGDQSVQPDRHAAIVYDDTEHCFLLESEPNLAVRLNGVPAGRKVALRDGDVVSIGGTGLRLVALCTPNFNWDAYAEAR